MSNSSSKLVKCPMRTKRVLLKLYIAEGEHVHVTDGNLMELACSDCRRFMRKDGEPVALVLHRFDFLGDYVETLIRYDDGATETLGR